jgi:serine/threonine-protein kinase
MPRDSEERLGLQATQIGAPTGDVDLYGSILGAGAQVGSYVVDAFCSRGGFGSIYRAHHAQTGQLAAVKLLHKHLASAENIVRRFYRESEMVGRVRHPNVVELHEFGQLDDGRPYLAMEWLEGKNLEAELLDKGALALPAAIELVTQLCAGLAAAHAAGIVHRDLKASNVMLIERPGQAPLLKLVDFGIAKIVDDEDVTRLTRTGIRIGTPAYMAPEQIIGRDISPQTDVYAVGVLLYHMLTGQLPFGGRTAIEVEDHHLHTPPPRASDVTELHGAVDDVILRCLAKEPGERYASVIELGDALRDSVADTSRPSRRFRAAGGMAVGLFVDCAELTESDADAALDAARALIATYHLSLVYETETQLLGIGSEEGLSLGALAAKVADAAIVAFRWPANVTVHVGTVQLLVIDGVVQYVGGDLLVPDAWAVAAPGVHVTKDAGEGW